LCSPTLFSLMVLDPGRGRTKKTGYGAQAASGKQ
jgi:hypothetical protein